jgi:hypothetical protein
MTRKPKIKQYSNEIHVNGGQDIQIYIDTFRTHLGNSLDAIRRMGIAFHDAVVAFNGDFDYVVGEFHKRFPEQTRHNWEMLDSIGSDSCDPRVFFLPRHLHTMRFLGTVQQENLFNMKGITVIRSQDGKEMVVDLNKLRSSEWNILYDKDNKRLRSHFEMKEYARHLREQKVIRERAKPRYELVKGVTGLVLKLRSDVHSLEMKDLEDIFSQVSLSNN